MALKSSVNMPTVGNHLLEFLGIDHVGRQDVETREE